MSDTTLKRRDIPSIPADAKGLKPALDALREAMQVYLGYRGDPLDRGLTVREAMTLGILDRSGDYTGGGGTGGSPVPGPPGPPGAPGGTYTPDLTPPPTPTGLRVTAGLTYLYVEWDVPGYSVGHGHGQTNVYGAQWSTDNPTPPTFSNAVPLATVADFATLYPHPVNPGARWCFWIKWQSVDGVESVTPAGGTNGVQGTSGKVGSSDLGDAVVLAGNLAPGSVTADKASLEIGGDNLLANNSFEVDSNADGLANGWAVYGSTQTPVATRTTGRISGFAQRVTWTGANTTTKGFVSDNASGGGVRGGWLAQKSYVVSFYARADTTKTVGCALGWTTAPASTTTIKNPNLGSNWQRYAWRITTGATVEASGALRLTCLANAGITGWIEFDDVQVEEGDYLSGYQGKLALNTIVAGDGAIANLAIGNAQMGNAAIDDAKVANISAAKLTVGDGTVGGNLKSANYGGGSAGWLLQPNGNVEFNQGTFRGALVAATGTFAGALSAATGSFRGAITSGSFTSYAWPAANGGAGFYLGNGGLLLGNYNAWVAGIGGYFQIDAATGNVTAPRFSIINGVATFGGALSAATGTFAGALSAATGTFAGALAAATGTFAGVLSAATGTFSGALTADAVNAVNTINIAGNAVTVPVSAYTAGSVPDGTVQSAAINAAGAPIMALGGVTVTNLTNTGFVVTLTLRRGATTLATAQAYVWPTSSGGWPVTLVVPPVKDEPGAGSFTYSLICSGGGAGSISVTGRGLLLLGTKK